MEHFIDVNFKTQLFMKKIQNYLLLLCSILILLQSCKDELTEPDTQVGSEELLPSDVQLAPVEELSAQDIQMVTFAKSLAKSLENQDVREYVKTEALKMFDGEHNLLYELVRQQRIGKHTFSARLANSYKNSHPNSRVNARVLFEEGMQNIPLLNIGVPIHTESWDVENFVPWVGVITSDFNEKTSEWVRAYDSEGELHILSARIEPNFPVVFVRLNERLDPITTKNGLQYQARYASTINPNAGEHINARIEESEDDDNSGGGGGSGGSGGGTSNCDRSGYEYMASLKFASMADLRDAEAYPNGGPEFELYIWSFDKAREDGRDKATWHSFKRFSATRNQVVYTTNLGLKRKPQWWARNLKLFDWDSDISNGYVGDELEYYWVESDSGDPVEAIDLELKGVIGIKELSSVQSTITVKQRFARGDTKLGTARINLCDSEPDSYDTGSLLFSVDAR